MRTWREGTTLVALGCSHNRPSRAKMCLIMTFLVPQFEDSGFTGYDTRRKPGAASLREAL